jgi:hypothetical protein
MPKVARTQTMDTGRPIRLTRRQRPETVARPDTPQRLPGRVRPLAPRSPGPRTTHRHRLPTPLALHRQRHIQFTRHGVPCVATSTSPLHRRRHLPPIHHLLPHHPIHRVLVITRLSHKLEPWMSTWDAQKKPKAFWPSPRVCGTTTRTALTKIFPLGEAACAEPGGMSTWDAAKSC